MDAVGDQVPVTGSKISAAAIASVPFGPRPPATSTRPSRRSVAVSPADVPIALVALHVAFAGSKISGVDPPPPVTRTLPSASNVLVWPPFRALAIDVVGVQTPVPGS